MSASSGLHQERVLCDLGRATQQRRRPRGRRFVYALMIFIGFFTVVECASRLREVWLPPVPHDPTAGFWASPVFVPCGEAEGKLGEEVEGKLCTDRDRGMTFYYPQPFLADKPRDVIRIVAFGGSSVKALQVEFNALALRLTDRVAARRKVEIINCGGNSYGSSRLLTVAREMSAYEPDLFLVYSGHNEFEDLYQLHHTPGWSIGLQRTLGRSALYRLLRDLALHGKALWRKRSAVPWAPDEPDVIAASEYNFNQEEIRERMAIFRDNLQSIIDLGWDSGAEVIIGTVPSNLRRPLPVHGHQIYNDLDELHRAGYREEARRRTVRLLCVTSRHQASAQENFIIRHLADTNGCRLADVESAVEIAEPNHIPGETLFRDWCHLNEGGNRILIQTFEREILDWMNAAEHRH